ncbi:extensin family protein [Halocynthiibacter sp. C4]|uniref:extensin-like domain-containing protein n=1 Tax=Halocynthiibacter sp. C4 TaxID=2992758 RepID=UPI00237A0E3B|nr:extensin family protein [Halocynthiibacter sp. C4]MDE0590306.1 extensin family protein [Halocynthiibacter sp. C4]
MIRLCTIALALCLGAEVQANAPQTSLLPVARPIDVRTQPEPIQRVSLVPVYYNAKIRPAPRPVSHGGKPYEKIAATAPVPAASVPVKLVTSQQAVRLSLRPLPRPANVPRALSGGAPAEITKTAAVKVPEPIPTSKKGSICGVRQIRGQKVSAIPGRIRGCGVGNPVRVTSVAGVALSRPALMDCNTAKALNTWVADGVVPTIGRLGGGVKRINVVAHYACRTRNNKKGAKISEHGKGKAVDVSGITLNNGVEITVLKGWNSKAQGKLLRAMHREACGPFGTVLGPNSDRYHRDHFHFDTASYRSGPYCK